MELIDIIEILVIALVIAILIVMRLNQRNSKLRQKAQMNMMFTSITHELLTPLTILSASIEHLRDVEPKHKLQYALMEINIQRSVRLLQQILETTKAQDGRLKLLVSHGDVMGYIRNTAHSIIPLMAKKHLKFSVKCQPESMMGWIDTDKLDKIIFNLLSNSAKYTTGENGLVELNVKTNDRYDRIFIEIRDNGCGIPESRKKHLFELFYDGEYRRFNTMGTGLGLSLTRELVYLNNGTISYESEEGKGTTFYITLPINKESFDLTQIDEKNKVDINKPMSAVLDLGEEESLLGNDFVLTDKISKNIATDTMKPKEIADSSDEDAYTILVVEDNLELLMLMKQLLSRKYKVETARHGREAVELIEKTELDLIISDVMMPVMDGYELVKYVKNSVGYRHLPIIMLTAKTQETDKMDALTVGADEYMTKPFKMKELLLRIDNMIANRQRITREFKQQCIEEVKVKNVTMPSPDNEFLEKAMTCVHNHLDDSDYDRDSFASDMGMSASSLYNKLRAVTGMNATSFIRDIRMKEACRLAKSTPGIRVSDLAYSVGYKDPKYFSTIFKKEFGMQPSEYIESITTPKQ
ncbi:MAG: response regulator [Prevotella sp.]|nr:response regulator [Prevotella sp.]